MKRFDCSNCGNQVFLTNTACVQCGHRLGLDPGTLSMIALGPAGDAAAAGPLMPPSGGGNGAFRACANAVHDACNWLLAEDEPGDFCIACRLNRTIPDLTVPGNLESWRTLEREKKRLIYSLLRFGLPLDATDRGAGALRFDFVAGTMTGHQGGLITINIAETDAVERERQKQNFDEPYRTLLGHLRHESGHFYWTVLVEAAGRHDEFRALFGDERADYGAALARHHADGPAAGWEDRFVSAYASMHPWEDWAESWAHLIHMVDAVETAETEGIEPRAAGLDYGAAWPYRHHDVYREVSFDDLTDRWVPLTIALNRLTRSLGHSDFYPFVTPAPAYGKLAFIHRLIREYGAR